nr:hypothetical protein [Haslea ostrearia]
MKNLLKVLLPSILGVAAYLIVNKYFPEKIEAFDEDPLLNLRGGADKTKLLSKIFKYIVKDRAIKIGLFVLFGSASIQYFQAEIEALLIEDVFSSVCVRDTDGKLKVVCDIIKEHELHLHTESMRQLIISNNLSEEHKISLLKIKLDVIINGEYGGKARFLVMIIIAATLTFTISGVGGLALMLEALYRLFQEGKISKGLYKHIIKALARRWGGRAVPVEHLLE